MNIKQLEEELEKTEAAKRDQSKAMKNLETKIMEIKGIYQKLSDMADSKREERDELKKCKELEEAELKETQEEIEKLEREDKLRKQEWEEYKRDHDSFSKVR